MEIIDVPRGIGKTAYLIDKSLHSDIPIIVASNNMQKEYIKKRAKNEEQILDKKLEIYTVNEFVKMRGRKLPEKVFVDDIQYVIEELLGTKVEIATTTSKSKELRM